MTAARLACGAAVAIIVTVVVAATCATVLEYPQIDPDDYRYLEIVQRARSGEGISATEAMVVENRWDHLWFVSTDAVVRFFRPLVVVSFWADWRPGADPRPALLRTNMLIHGLCCALAGLLFVRLMRPLAALLACLLFASFAAHAEAVWYVSGRTDTLAALGFIAALLVHVAAPVKLRYLALAPFGFALLAKETAILLPALLILLDRATAAQSTERSAPGLDRGLYAGYAATVMLFLLARSYFAGRPALVQPYFVAPWSADFPGHLLLQARSYLGNLLAAELTEPFSTRADVATNATPWGWMAIVAAPVLLAPTRRRLATLLFFAALAVATWLPTSIAYISERYLYLPSLGLAGAAGLAIETARTRFGRALLIALLLVWAGHQSVVLYRKNTYMSHVPRDATYVNHLLGELGQGPPRGGRVLFVNFPSSVIPAQFLEPQLRIFYGDPTLSARVLTLMPLDQTAPQRPSSQRLGARRLRIESTARLMPQSDLFALSAMTPGSTYDGAPLGFSVEVTGPRGNAIEVVTPDPIEQYTVFLYTPPGRARDPATPLGAHLQRGRIEIVEPSEFQASGARHR